MSLRGPAAQMFLRFFSRILPMIFCRFYHPPRNPHTNSRAPPANNFACQNSKQQPRKPCPGASTNRVCLCGKLAHLRSLLRSPFSQAEIAVWPDAVASAMPRIKPSGPSSGSLQIPSSASSEVSELLDRDITPEDYEMPRTKLFELREAHAKALHSNPKV